MREETITLTLEVTRMAPKACAPNIRPRASSYFLVSPGAMESAWVSGAGFALRSSRENTTSALVGPGL